MSSRSNPLWDIPTRVSHWLIVGFVGFSWWSAEYDRLDLHTWSGYGLLGVLIFRIIWGFVGSQTARFSQFLTGPSPVIQYAKTLFERTPKPHRGHNPMGAWSVVLLLTFLIAQVMLGMFAEDVDGLASGPLSYYVSYDTARWAAEMHEEIFNVLLALIAVHIVFIGFYLLYKKDNLIGPMITGQKANVDTSELKLAPLWLAFIVLIIAIVAVWLMVT